MKFLSNGRSGLDAIRDQVKAENNKRPKGQRMSRDQISREVVKRTGRA